MARSNYAKYKLYKLLLSVGKRELWYDTKEKNSEND